MGWDSTIASSDSRFLTTASDLAAETVMADAALQLEQRVEGNCRKGLKFRLLSRKGLADALRGAVQAGIGDVSS
ncbi:hypothetical protein B5V02_20305 [Mesorhizobium kowhaii]|uniref:Uncharacterized protein n=1 Tax=Mesorhizobium kowhaii TaxID=1300272 RepID=A0A2W7C0Y6_9HYPH|nr:hypothetical protein B5V02_20305 [Mesorhizobium kowhaii]